jgi:hypothetical protein
MGGFLSWLLVGCSPNKPDINRAFVEGSSFKVSGQQVQTSVVQLGQIAFPSGKVTPKDTMVLDVECEVDRSIPTSLGDAEAVIAKFPSGDERVAFLRIKFHPQPAERHVIAIRMIGPQWHESYREAYPVDSGYGGFVDHVAQKEINALLEAEDDKLAKKLHQELEQQTRPTWSWSNFEVKPGLRILVVSSGFGDGGYKTFYGLNAKGNVVSLVTDFGVISTQLSSE